MFIYPGACRRRTLAAEGWVGLIPADSMRFMDERAGSTTVEIDASHAATVSQHPLRRTGGGVRGRAR
jgi:hypothetical protein